MKNNFQNRKLWLLLGFLTLAVVPNLLAQSANISVFASGFNNPRGLKFGPDGYLYVAEGGAGGSLSTIGQCTQANGVGPYTGDFTARILKVAPNGSVSTVVDGLPSSQTNPASGSLTSGVADVAFVKGMLYAILAGAGCSHGLNGTNNAVIRVNSDGTWAQVANLSAFQKAHQVANPEPDDFEPDGTWYGMIAAGGTLYAVEPNHGELDAITTDGQIKRVADISHFQGHIVPTAIVDGGQNFFVGNLERFPIQGDTSKILKITRTGEITTVAIDFSTILGLAFDNKHRLYVLENTTGNPFPTPGTGKILRIDGKHKYTEIATGLNLPTAMTFGPDGNLYVSNWGFGPPPVGMGEVVKVTLPRD
jgi:hypothetical protein